MDNVKFLLTSPSQNMFYRMISPMWQCLLGKFPVKVAGIRKEVWMSL